MNKYLLIIISFIFFILSCENGLIGLGEQVDIEAPVLIIGSNDDGSDIQNGGYVHGSIVLSGEVSDDMGISSVGITIIDSVTNETSSNNAEINYSSTITWSYSVDTTSFSDGEKIIKIKVTDTSPIPDPKTDSEEMILYFDNTPPLVLVTNPAGYATSDYADSIITIKGETYDQFQVRSVDINMISGNNDDLDDVSGTATWSTVYRSSGTGNYEFVVTATDYAGNVSQGFYHLDDIIAVNDNTYIPVKDIYDVREGITPDSVPVLTPSDLQSPSVLLTSLPFSIDLAGDEPQIAISNPDPLAPANENVLAGNAKAIGSITDDDGINISSIEINIDGGGWGSVDNVTGSGLFVKWDHDLSALGGGQHTLQIQAEDIFGLPKESSIVNFSINVGAPELEITSPEIGDFLNTGTFTISGTAHDTDNIDEMQVSLDDGVSWNAVSHYSNTIDVNWTHDVTGQADGNVLIKVRATDDGSFWSYSNLQVNIDTEDPENSFIYPSHNSFVNGLVEIRGASSDNNQLETVRIRIGDVDPWITIPAEDRYNWTYNFNSLDYENSSDATETSSGSGVWALNIYAELTDVAGNTSVTTAGGYVLKIDNSLDRPSVNVISPYDGQSIGGATLITGTSFDDDGEVYGVYMQIDVNTASGGTPDFSDTAVDLYQKDDTTAGGIDFDGNGPISTIDETAWYLLDGKNPWSVELNTNGELYSTDGNTGDLYIRIKAIDKDGGVNSISGEYEELYIKMDDSVPYIENLFPISDEYVNDSFNITGDINDDSQIKNLEISYNGGAQYHNIIKNGIIDSAYGGGSVTSSYTMNIPVDTSNIPDVGSVTSDSLSIRVKVTDDTNYQTLETLRYYVDNTLPTGTSSDYNSISGSYVNAIISGTATDTGTVNGISHVEAYIVREISGTKYFYNPKIDDTTIVASTMNINGTDHEYPTTGYEDYLITIDSTAETLGGSNSDGDGIAEELNVGINYDWKYMFDSNNIPDGSVELHYVVFDKAGNASHYEQAGFIKNNIPEIESITVGTDLNGNGAIEVSEETTFLSATFSATDFTARNDELKITVNLAAGDVNAPLVYSVTYNGGAELITNVTEAQIDMSNHTTYGDVAGNGAGFVCTITDDAGLVATETINISIDNVDDIDPEAEFGELDADTSVPENGGEKEGHIEERSWSNYNNTVADPDVSGKIVLNGSASDNQRIQYIYVWIDTDGDGNLDDNNDEKILVANEHTDGTLIEADSNFDIILENLTETGGHDVSFTYEWDSSTLANIAGDDIQIKLLVEDYYGNTNIEQSYPGACYNLMTVDVVPYISSIYRNPGNYNTFRSRFGKFPLRRSETLSQINGFNLGTGGGSDALGVDTLSTGLIGDIDSIITPTGSTGTSQIRFTVPSSINSGWIRLFVNGVEAINNINDNTQFINREYDSSVSYSTYWTDDRQILAFEADETDFFDDNNGDPQFAAMDMASDGTLYSSWSTYSTSDVSYSTLAANSVVDVWHGYDPPEFTDIDVNGTDVNVLYLANYHGGNASNWNNDEGAAGGLYLYDPTAPDIESGRDPLDPTYRFELMYHNQTLLQFRNLRVARAELGATDRIHIAYYDNNSGSIKYSSVTENYNPPGNDDTHEIPWINIDGGSDADDTNFGTGLVTQYDGALSRASTTGSYSSVILDEDNNPVIVYYDGENQTMRLARSDNNAPSALNDWSVQNVFENTDINYNFTGDYISAEVDGNGYLHIVAYKSSQGKVVYIKSTNNPESGAAYTFGTSVTLDTSAGVWADLYINKEGATYSAYITYLDSKGINSFDGLKIAFWDDTADTDFDGIGDGDWEYSNVPLALAIKNERISIVTKGETGVSWTSAVGYKAGSHYYVSYLY